MFFLNAKRIIKNALRNIKRNTFLTIATLIVVILTMFSILVMIFTNLITDTIVSAINKQVDILVEINDSALQQDINNFVNDLKNQKVILNVEYIPKEKVFENFAKTFTNIKNFWERNNLSNPLPAMVRVEVANPMYRQAVIDFISSPQYENIVNKDFFMADIESYKAKQIIKITNIVKDFIYFLTVLFFLFSILIIFNTIRINIFSRKDELHIMQLIGAKYYYMRMPFIVEGALYGIIGAFITSILAIVIIYFLSPILSLYIGQYNIGFDYSFYKYFFSVKSNTLFKFYISNYFNFLGFLVIGGILVGSFSALIATYKYEKI